MASTSLGRFFEQNPSIKHYPASSPEFECLRSTYLTLSYKPSAIARPQTADEVAAIVTHCASNDTPFVVRAGGHDAHGRSTMPDTLQIDMRNINYVHVAPDRSTARIGGGILQGKLVEELATHELMTATGTVGTVGFVGWATLGGYGPFSSSLGLGVDQIVGARIVNAEGTVVEADERLLEGLRGGGGSLGVVVELTIKVYPAQEIQAGMLVFDTQSLSTVATTYFNNFNKLLDSVTVPENLDLQPSVINIPNVGNAFATTFAWAGPLDDQAKEWQEKISSLAPIMVTTVKTTTLASYVAEITSMIPPIVHAGIFRTVSLRGPRLSDSSIKTFAKHIELQPDTGCLTTFHSFHGSLAQTAPMPSIFKNREAHYVLEMVGLSLSSEDAEAAGTWANGFANEMGKTEGNLESTYLSLTPSKDVDLKKVYGEHLEKLLTLKKELDPKNVFKNTLPQLGA